MEQRIIALEKRVEKLEEVSQDTKINMIKDKYELKDIIREAVEQALTKVVEEISIKVEMLEKRVGCLETKDQTDALCQIKEQKKFTMGMKTTIITVLISGTVGFWIKIFWDFVLTR
jgi:hypothetical protein